MFKAKLSLVRYACLLLIAGFIFTCSDQNNNLSGPPETVNNDDYLKNYLQEHFSSEIVDKGSYYLVEGDMAFRKDDLRRIMEENTTASDSGGLKKVEAIWCSLKWNNGEEQDFTYDVDFLPAWLQSEFEQAIRQWECANPRIKFRRVSGSARIVAGYDPNWGDCGTTVLPGLNPPASWGEYNLILKASGSAQNTVLKRRRTILHEVGHRLGLAHSANDPHPCASAGTSASVIPGTNPNGDALSVMRIGSASDGGCGAERSVPSTDDQLGICWLYNPSGFSIPVPSAPYINGTAYNNHPKIYWNAVSYAHGYKIYKRYNDPNGNFFYVTSTSATEYIDYEETLYQGISTKMKVYYKIKAFNDCSGESGFSNYRSFTVENAY